MAECTIPLQLQRTKQECQTVRLCDWDSKSFLSPCCNGPLSPECEAIVRPSRLSNRRKHLDLLPEILPILFASSPRMPVIRGLLPLFLNLILVLRHPTEW